MTAARRGPAALLLALVAALVAAGTGCASSTAEGIDRPVERVLIVSLPYTDWETVEGADMPVLRDLVEGSAIADVTTRIGRRSATSTDAYLTIGAGTRAVAPSIDTAVAVEPEETYGGLPAGEFLARRLGEVPEGIAYLGIGAAIDANESSAFGAEVGLLGDRLDEAGVHRAVVANADAVEGFVSVDPPPEGAYARGAATALMGSDGTVPDGAVGRSLLADDPGAAFGWRLDPAKVLAAFDQAWDREGRVVALVEASDLSRVAAYGSLASAPQRRALREQALADADVLLGALLERVDPERDAVLVLSPVSPSAAALGLAVLQAPGVDGGLLQSATTRRDGYVQMADVAPTVLDLLGEPVPTEMEGRPFRVGGRDVADRTAHLVEAAEAAEFRDATLPLAITGITALLVVLALAVRVRRRLPRRARRLLPPLVYGALGIVPASFLVGPVGAVRADLPAQVVVVAVVAGAVAVAADRAEAWRPGAGPLVAVGTIVVLIGVDLLLGAPLQLNTLFGYSVAVAGRFTGVGNLAFALFGSATIVLAGLLADRLGERGVRLAVALMAVVVVVEGLPMLGADVGGVLSMVPAFGVCALILWGRSIGWREAVGLVAGTLVVLLVFALVDAARPAEVETHLARFADHVLSGRWDTLTKSLGRRWQASLGGAELAGWVTVATTLAAAGAYAAMVAAGRMGPGATRPLRHRPTIAAAAGLGVLAVVGLVANDSSVAVPLTMLIVVGPAVMLRVLAEDPSVPAVAAPSEGGS
ncbi:MAG TPA: hypothetical protein VKZ72_10460 [Acidimicrobiales bacterium]|nr:hypothetical protein [Acidimicrobiales bacterium]